ncbi:MAG: sulfatase [Bacteroidales bacterium]|nr:sulfatase [Bacteroidales bacterium]
MNNRLLQGCCLSAFVVGSFGCKTAPEEEKAEKPNIIYIMTDDHANRALSCYGGDLIETPNLDRLAEEGMRFNHSFVTNSISAPSRATLLTGQYSHKNGVIDNAKEFDGSQMTFPKLLRDAGYQTAMIGKWHLKSEPTGFDYWKVLPGQGSYYNPDFIEMGERMRDTGYVTDLITDEVINWIDQAKGKEKPFCVLYHHKAPHRAWWPGPDHLNTFDDKQFPEPETLFDDYEDRKAAEAALMEIDSNMYLSSDLKVKPEHVKQSGMYPDTDNPERFQAYQGSLDRMTEQQKEAWNEAYADRQQEFLEFDDRTGNDFVRWKYQQYMEDYLRCIAGVDDNVGRLLDYLEENDMKENTIIVYTSDQGFYLGEHGWFDKRFMYEESLRMPLLVRYPKEVEAGSVNEDIVLNLDFAPTFLDYAGVEKPEQMQGRSLRPVLKGETPPNWRESMYYHYYEYPAWHATKRHYGIRTDRYKLIHFYYDIDEWEFYDLEEDPNELNNEIDNPKYEETIKMLKKRMEDLREKFGDSEELSQKYIEQWIESGHTESQF